MALRLSTTIQRWTALSTDDKPLTAPNGSELHVVNTGEQFVFHDGLWVVDLRMAKAIKQAAFVP